MLPKPEYLHVQINGKQLAVNGSTSRPRVNDGYVFEVHHKQLALDGDSIKQFWLDRRTIFPTKGRRATNYSELLRYGLNRGEQLPQGLVSKSVDHIGLAALMPHIRDIGANRVISDAALHPAQLEQAAADLEIMLQGKSSTITPQAFMDTSSELVGPRREFQISLGATYHQMSADLIELIRKDIYEHRDLALSTAAAQWNRWKKRFIRPERHQVEIDAMNAISVEARTSLLQVYSGLWHDLLQQFTNIFKPPFIRFHQLWHCEWRWEENGRTMHLFQGHCVGLHPAGSLLIQTPAGRSLIEPLVLTEGTDSQFFRFLHGLTCALHVYAATRDGAKEDRQHRRDQGKATAVANADRRRRGRRRRRH